MVAIKKAEKRATPSPGLDTDKVKALSHPVRLKALFIFSNRVASPSEVAREIDMEVNKVAYHVRRLVTYGCVELVKTEPRRGATEHYYRATERAIITDEDWLQIPRGLQNEIVADQTRLAVGEISSSLTNGVFNERDDRRQSLLTMDVDEQGWSEAMDILQEAEERLLALEQTSLLRLNKKNARPVPLAVSLVGFERAAVDRGQLAASQP